MSEFKFACPVCGQHMKCDATQGGSVMECPTCFQKIIAPQPPASDDQKFILTGRRSAEKPVRERPDGPGGRRAGKKFPAGIGGRPAGWRWLLAGAAVFVFRGKIFKSGGNAPRPANREPMPARPAPPPKPPPPKPALVAPPASDTNWMLDLSGDGFPDTPAAGRIHGQDFIVSARLFRTAR